MGDVSQIETSEGGPCASAVLDPSPAEFQAALNKSFTTCLEIGCGVEPRSSWGLHSDDLWVGCDPALRATGEKVSVHLGVGVSPGAKMFVFKDMVADIPRFSPDFILAVAPNPQDVASDKIFNEGLEPFLDPKKPQFFLVVLDNRTVEAKGYLDEAKQRIMDWMRQHGFNPARPNEQIRQRFHPNSADLGAFGNTKMCFLRTPGRTVGR